MLTRGSVSIGEGVNFIWRGAVSAGEGTVFKGGQFPLEGVALAGGGR